MKKIVLGCLMVVFGLYASVHAAIVDIDFNSLPSSQGWVFEHSTTGSHAYTTEAGMMSLSGGVLTGNTVGAGYASPSGAGYTNYTPLSQTDPWQLSWTMRVNAYETSYPYPPYSPPYGYWGSYLIVNNGEIEVGLGFGPEGISLLDGSSSQEVTMDIGQFHDYRIEFTPGGLGVWELYVDSELITSGNGRSYGRANSFGFGDGTGAANAQWQMTAYSFSQTTVPLPSAMVFLGLGLVGLCAVSRKKRAA